MKKLLILTPLLFIGVNSFANENGNSPETGIQPTNTNTVGLTIPPYKSYKGSTDGAFYVGPTFNFSSTWLLNKNFSIDENKTPEIYNPSWGYSVGIVAGSYFSNNLGLGVDIVFGQHNQRLTGGGGNASAGANDSIYHSKISLTTIDIPLTLIIKPAETGYFEIGFQYSAITKAGFTREGPGTANVDSDVSAIFPKSNMALIAGFGMDTYATDNLVIAFGFRGSYGVSNLYGVSGMGNDMTIDYPDPQKTGSLAVGLHLGIKYMMEY